MILAMERSGIEIEVQHHEVGTAGQAEIDMRYRHLAHHGGQVDALQVRGEERGVQRRLFGHLHAETTTSRTTALACTCTSPFGTVASLCSIRSWHLWGLSRISAAGTSAAYWPMREPFLPLPRQRRTRYRRLVPGYEAPVNLVYSQRNRSAACRIPALLQESEGKAHRVSVPGPLLQSVSRFFRHAHGRARRGGETKLNLQPRLMKDLFDLPAEELAKVGQVPLRWRRRCRR